MTKMEPVFERLFKKVYKSSQYLFGSHCRNCQHLEETDLNLPSIQILTKWLRKKDMRRYE